MRVLIVLVTEKRVRTFPLSLSLCVCCVYVCARARECVHVCMCVRQTERQFSKYRLYSLFDSLVVFIQQINDE